jgi:transcription elongation factor Elf1
MKNALDSATIEVPCPHCGKKTSESIGKLKLKRDITCRHCRQVIAVDATQMRREVAKVEQALAKLSTTLGRLGK